MSLRLPALCAAVFAFLVACAGSETDTSSRGEADLVSDIASMMQRSDGLFDVLCKDGRRETASAADIVANRVCNAGGSSGGPVVVPGPDDVVIYTGYRCRPEDAIAAVNLATNCRELSERERAMSVRDKFGFCKNLLGFPTDVRTACYWYKDGSVRSELEFFEEDFCWGEPIAKLDWHEACSSLSDSMPPFIGSVRARGGCQDLFSQNSLRGTCEYFRSREGGDPDAPF